MKKVLVVGMIVKYKTTEADQSKMAEHRSVCNVKEELPAVIVAVWPNDVVNLKVLLDGQGEIWQTSVLQGEEIGEYSLYPSEENKFIAEIEGLIIKLAGEKHELEQVSIRIQEDLEASKNTLSDMLAVKKDIESILDAIPTVKLKLVNELQSQFDEFEAASKKVMVIPTGAVEAETVTAKK